MTSPPPSRDSSWGAGAFVEQAKQYVDENYMDSNLSLNSVGDFVGISASYLSEIWSDWTESGPGR